MEILERKTGCLRNSENEIIKAQTKTIPQKKKNKIPDETTMIAQRAFQ